MEKNQKSPPMTDEEKRDLVKKKREELRQAESMETSNAKDGVIERSYWRPRLWVAMTTVITFVLGVYCSYIEITSVVVQPTRPLFCLFLLGAIPITLLLERLRK